MTFFLKVITIMRKECELMRNFDYSELAKRSWDSKIIGLVAQIHEYKSADISHLKAKYPRIRTCTTTH